MFELRSGYFLRKYTVTGPDGRKREFTGNFRGTERVKKYNYIKDCWILEQFAPPELVNVEELPESRDGGYEPLYVFRDSKFRPLPLNMRVVQIIVSRALAPSVSRMERASEDREEERKRDQEEQFFLEEALDLSAMQSLLHHGEAIIVPPNYGEIE